VYKKNTGNSLSIKSLQGKEPPRLAFKMLPLIAKQGENKSR
jgi:hypothetical protein